MIKLTAIFLLLSPACQAFEASFYPGSHTTLETLGNGLTLIVTEDASQKTGSVRIWVKGGGADELPGKTGIAHLFEHMMFSSPDFEAIDRRHATESNAMTTNRATVFVNDLLPDALEDHLKAEGARFQGLEIGQAALENEKGAVHSEIQGDMTGWQDFSLATTLHRRAFPGHAYGGWSVGNLEDLAGLDAADCMAFYRRIYVPSNTAVLVAGPWPRERVSALLSQYFGGWKAAGKGTGFSEPREFKAGYLGIADFKARYPCMMAGFRLPGPGLRPGSLDDFLLHFYFYSPSFRLRQSLNYERSLISYSAPFFAPEEGGLFCVGIAVNPGVRPEKVVETILALPEMAARLTEPIFKDYVNEWRWGYRGYCLYPANLNQRLGQAWACGSLDEFAAFMQAAPAFTRKDLQARAKEFFAAGRVAAVAAGMP